VSGGNGSRRYIRFRIEIIYMTLIKQDKIKTSIGEVLSREPNEYNESEVTVYDEETGSPTTLELLRIKGEDTVRVIWYVPKRFTHVDTNSQSPKGFENSFKPITIDDDVENGDSLLKQSEGDNEFSVEDLGKLVGNGMGEIVDAFQNSEYPFAMYELPSVQYLEVEELEPHYVIITEMVIE